MYPYPYKLTAIQTFALPIVKWLLGGQLGAGRTTVMAHAFVQLAIERQGEPIHLFDHGQAQGNDHFRGSQIMARACQKITKEYYAQYNWQFKQSDMTLTCVGKLTSVAAPASAPLP